MVPLDGSHASLQAVALASQIAHKNKGKVYAVRVIEVKRTMPLDARLDPEAESAERMIGEAEQVARQHKADIVSEVLQAREAGHALVDEAVERGVDLIVVGMEQTEGLGEGHLGRAAPYVLESAPCEVWICRHVAEATA